VPVGCSRHPLAVSTRVDVHGGDPFEPPSGLRGSETLAASSPRGCHDPRVTSEHNQRITEARRPAGLDQYAAAGLIFFSSASVLVIEVVMLRLLAPYFGLTLETSTMVIGLALAAIAMGAWAGGRMADRVDPRLALGPLFGLAGVVVAATPAAVRSAGAVDVAIVLPMVAVVTIVLPSTMLAAVTPMVTKLRLTSLNETGTVVGRLSGIGTAGAIVGTVLTGFVLISRAPVSTILIGLGIGLVLVAAVLQVGAWRRWPAAVTALVIVAGGAGVAVAPGGCDAETIYHCAVVTADRERPSGRVLLLDGAPHSYVDLDDPTYLRFAYARAVASVIDVAYPPGQPLRAYHLGAGALTLPRYLERVRPGTTSLVSEIDPGVIRIGTEQLGLRLGDHMEVRIEDGRLGLGRLADDSRDLVIGDAFGGISVPWHLTTSEAVGEVERVLTEEGSYAVNLIDRGPLAFARAEVRTLTEVFDHVALAAEEDTLFGGDGGNLVAIASNSPVDAAAIAGQLAERDTDWVVLTGSELGNWVGDAEVLTDDYAPVDQLLTPYATR
jgi:spermidine synthase